MLYKLFLISVTLLISYSCKTNKEKIDSTLNADGSLMVIDIDSIQVERELLLSSIFNSFEIIPLETSMNCMIGMVNQLEIDKDTIYVLDSMVGKGLYKFDGNGGFIRKIGSVGKGPGEYLFPASFAITGGENKQILILDNHQNKIIVYSMFGDFIRDINISSSGNISIQLVAIGEYIFIDQLTTSHREVDYLLYGIDYMGEIKKRYLSINDYQKGFAQPFNVGLNFTKTYYDVKYTKPLFDTLFSISAEGNIKPFLAISTKNKVNSSEIEKVNLINDIDEVRIFYRDSKKFLGITDYLEDKNLIMFRFKNNFNTHNMFYWPLSKQMQCSNWLIDDITFSKRPLRFYSTTNTSFITCIQNTFSSEIQNIVENVKNEKIQVPDNVKSRLINLDNNSNPIIIKYTSRERYVDFKID
jgi:hypothetical protein